MLYYGIVGFAVIMAASFLRGTRDKYDDFCVGAAIPIFLLLLLPFMLLTVWLRTATIDGQLRAIDLALGLDGFAVARWIPAHGLHFLVAFVYNSLPLMMALAWALERPRTLIRAAVIGAAMALPFYLLFPAVGPKFAFANFPSAAAHLLPVISTHPRNCVPSMHFTWALLLALNVTDRRWRWIFALFAALMSFATVASGQHYFIDIIVAIPFTFAVQWIAERTSAKRSQLAAREAVAA